MITINPTNTTPLDATAPSSAFCHTDSISERHMEFTTSGNIPLTASNKPKSGEVCGVSRDRIVTLLGKQNPWSVLTCRDSMNGTTKLRVSDRRNPYHWMSAAWLSGISQTWPSRCW